MKQVQMSDSINELLDKIVQTRKNNNYLVTTKKGVVAYLIMSAYKKEINNGDIDQAIFDKYEISFE